MRNAARLEGISKAWNTFIEGDSVTRLQMGTQFVSNIILSDFYCTMMVKTPKPNGMKFPSVRRQSDAMPISLIGAKGANYGLTLNSMLVRKPIQASFLLDSFLS